MDEYIKRNELAEMIEKNVNLPLGEGYTYKDHELVDWCKAECVRMAHCLPFVCDVVPKSEVERLEGELIVESTRRKNAVNAYHDAKSEVAREIFDEILRTIFSKIPNKVMLINQERGFSDGVIFGKREAFFDMVNNLAELKKKYTEGEP